MLRQIQRNPFVFPIMFAVTAKFFFFYEKNLRTDSKQLLVLFVCLEPQQHKKEDVDCCSFRLLSNSVGGGYVAFACCVSIFWVEFNYPKTQTTTTTTTIKCVRRKHRAVVQKSFGNTFQDIPKKKQCVWVQHPYMLSADQM